MFEKPHKPWTVDILFHNRLNFHVYGGDHFTGTLQLRNRLMFGETVRMVNGYKKSLGADIGWADLTSNLVSGDSYVLNSTIDRLWLQYSTDVFTATAGRQRINWGQTFVWNVNDIFNAYSYFDFDYEERPGSDALRLQIYPGYTSAIDIGVKIDSANKVTAAVLYRFNVLSYDIQFLGGVLQEEDFVGGLGWSGNIGGAGFRGEAGYFHPVDNPKDTSGMFMFSAGLDYAFSNSLMLQAEYLYADRTVSSGFSDLYSGALTVKQLAFTEHSVFFSASYPITPLFTATAAAMYFPNLNGLFAGPSISYNLADNFDLAFFLQHFSGDQKGVAGTDTTRMQLSLLFLRLKWSF